MRSSSLTWFQVSFFQGTLGVILYGLHHPADGYFMLACGGLSALWAIGEHLEQR